MFIVDTKRASVELRETGELEPILRGLEASGLTLSIRSMLAGACEAANLPVGSLNVDQLVLDQGPARRTIRRWSGLVGELLFSDDRACLLQPMGGNLYATEVRHHTTESGIDSFCASVEAAARATLDGRRLRGMDFTWRAANLPSPRRRLERRNQEEALDVKPAEYSEQESSGARLLVDPNVKMVMRRLAQLGRIRSVDAAAAEADDAMTNPLVEAELLRKEYLVLCKNDSHTICVVENRGDLDSGDAGRLICSDCGRPFSEELVQEIFSLTQSGKALLDGSRWMTIWITDILVEAGIPKDEIKWNPSIHEDELDILTEAFGPRVLFELKDREFGLGDAYPFAFRVVRYGGDYGVVVTTEKVEGEAQKFFKEQGPTLGPVRIELIQGAGIEGRIRSLTDQLSRAGVHDQVMTLSESVGLNLVPIVEAWMGRINRTAQRTRK